MRSSLAPHTKKFATRALRYLLHAICEITAAIMYIMNNLDLSNKVQSVDKDDIAVECA